MSPLLSETIAKLAKIIPRLGSDHDGEVVACVRALIRTLAADGKTLHDLAEQLADSRAAPFVWPYPSASTARPAPPAPKPQPAPVVEPMPDGPLTREEVARFSPDLYQKIKRRRSDTDFVTLMRQLAGRQKFRFDPSPANVERWRALLLKHKLVLAPRKAAA